MDWIKINLLFYFITLSLFILCKDIFLSCNNECFVVFIQWYPYNTIFNGKFVSFFSQLLFFLFLIFNLLIYEIATTSSNAYRSTHILYFGNVVRIKRNFATFVNYNNVEKLIFVYLHIALFLICSLILQSFIIIPWKITYHFYYFTQTEILFP